MNNLIQDLEAYVRAGKPGDRLPTVRELIKQHNATQSAVKTALADLKDRNLITSHVGRGTFIAEDSSVRQIFQDQKRILLLTKQGVMPRGVRAMEGLGDQFAKDGHRAIQVIYQNFEDLLEMLPNSAPFDGCVLSTRFSTVPVSLLSSLKRLARVTVIDGAIVSGLDVDCVGINWSDAMDLAVSKLRSLGHRKVLLVATTSEAGPMAQAKSHFASLVRWGIVEGDERSIICVDNVAGDEAAIEAEMADKLAERLSGRDAGGYTAVVTLGLFDGAVVVRCLDSLRLEIPDDISVIALGTNDILVEHLDFLTTAGSSTGAAVDRLSMIMRDRLADAPAAYRTHYLPTDLVERSSCRAVV